MIKMAIENKVFVNGTIVDAQLQLLMEAEFFGSNKKSCTECLRNNKHYFHNGAVMSIIGDVSKLTIGIVIEG